MKKVSIIENTIKNRKEIKTLFDKDNIVNILMQMDLAAHIDSSRDSILLKDSVYTKTLNEMAEKNKAYRALSLSKEDREIVESYVEAVEDINLRIDWIGYIAGVRDAILLFNQIGLLKDNAGEELEKKFLNAISK